MRLPRFSVALFAAAGLASCSLVADDQSALAIPHIQQEKLLCVPTAAAMILAFYGDRQSPRKLKVLATGRKYDPTEPFNDFAITLYRDIIAAVRELGYVWQERSLTNDDAGFEQGLGIIAAELRRGHPVMIDLSVPYGHTVVVSEVNDEQRSISLIDPEQPSPGTVALTFDQLRDHWNESAYGGNFRSLILTQPKGG